MKRSHFTIEQIVFALRQAESGMPVAEVCRSAGAAGISVGGSSRKIPPQSERSHASVVEAAPALESQNGQ